MRVSQFGKQVAGRLMPWGVALAIASGCQAASTPSFVGVLSLSVTTVSGPTTIAGTVPTACELNVDFGTVPIGLISTGSVEIGNHGKTAVSFTPAGSNLDPELTAGAAALEQAPLQPGASTSFSITFEPTRAGTASSSVLIPTSLAAGLCGSSSAIVLNLTGNGIEPGVLVVTPSALDFGTVLINTTTKKTVTLSNASANPVNAITCVLTGADAHLFTLTGCPSSLLPHGAASIEVAFSPLALETRSQAVAAFGGGEGERASLDLAGSPVDEALIVAPNPIDFGYVPLTKTVIGCTTVTNQANVPVDINGVGAFNNQGAFGTAATDDATPPHSIKFPITIVADTSAKVCFTLTPPVTQEYSGEVTLETTDPSGSNPIVLLTGWGGGPQISCTPSSIDFGSTPTGTTSTVPVICTNPGTAIPSTNLTIDPPLAAPSVFSAQFDSTKDPYPLNGLAPGESAQIDVSYSPTATSDDVGTLSIKSNGGKGQTVQIPITGAGVNVPPCQFVIGPTQLDFANVPVGASSVPLAFAVQNVGTNICLVRGPTISNDPSGSFHILSTSIAPDPTTQKLTIPAPAPGVISSFTVTIGFAPTVAGSFSAELAFAISDPSGPNQVVPLVGTSEPACLAIEPGSLQFGTLGESSTGAVCGSSSRSFTVFNTCVSPATLASSTIQSGPGDETPQFSLGVGAALPQKFAVGDPGLVYTISFDPTTVGTHTAQLLASDGTVETLLSLSGSVVATSEERLPFPIDAGPGTVTDAFVVGPPPADVLFVLDVADDAAAQANLVSAAPGFFQAASGVDYRVALTTDNDDAAVKTAESGRLLPCPTCSVMGPAPTIVSPASVPAGGTAPDPATVFATLCGAAPVDGYPPNPPNDKHFFLALYNALQNAPSQAVDFFRPGAYFAAITANDDNEDDYKQPWGGGSCRHLV